MGTCGLWECWNEVGWSVEDWKQLRSLVELNQGRESKLFPGSDRGLSLEKGISVFLADTVTSLRI